MSSVSQLLAGNETNEGVCRMKLVLFALLRSMKVELAVEPEDIEAFMT